MSAPAGWYPDPADAARWRWWDGVHWAAPAPTPAATLQQVPTGTPWIWLVVLLPLLSTPALLLVDWRGYIELSLYWGWLSASPDPAADMEALLPYAVQVFSTFLWPMLVGWLVYAATVVSSWLDHRTLRARGIERPFAWPWAFLGSTVYLVGRSVIVRRRTGRGLAPLWTGVAVYAANIVFAIVVSVMIMSTAFELLTEMLPYLTSY